MGFVVLFIALRRVFFKYTNDVISSITISLEVWGILKRSRKEVICLEGEIKLKVWSHVILSLVLFVCQDFLHLYKWSSKLLLNASHYNSSHCKMSAPFRCMCFSVLMTQHFLCSLSLVVLSRFLLKILVHHSL